MTEVELNEQIVEWAMLGLFDDLKSKCVDIKINPMELLSLQDSTMRLTGDGIYECLGIAFRLEMDSKTESVRIAGKDTNEV